MNDPESMSSSSISGSEERPDESLPAVAPDQSEMDMSAEGKLDDGIPVHAYHTLPVVGLGGSAGSLTALQSFFSEMAADSGMAFVVVVHLSPDRESSLAAILQRQTTMPVSQVTGALKLQPNHVYIIPPGKHLLMTDGHVSLSDLDQPRGRRVAVDLFFRTLADTHGPHATAIVLSGGDSDGAIGIKRIKERGGLTIAQDPSETEQDGMPRSAIETGMVDWVLPVKDIPTRLIDYRQLESRVELPPEDEPVRQERQPNESVLREILAFLKMRTGRDFAYYKRATVLRRIARRMQVNNLPELPAYLAFLRTNPGEAGALLQDLLISVTNFFRDRQSFVELEKKVPEFFRDKGPSDQVRVWVPACATGEEAYSIAMMLSEYASLLESPPKIQVFATDIDEDAINAARDGVYPETIVADVSEDRLRRFFSKDHGRYRVKREIRERVLFAVHDLLKDSPFSRLDLISCRNLLIYLNRDAQALAFDIFHFAMRPDGKLFLGSSESAEEARMLFVPHDKAHRIYSRRSTSRIGLPVLSGPLSLGSVTPASRTEGPVISTVHVHVPMRSLHASGLSDDARNSSWEGVHFKLMEHFSPPSLIINAEYEIIHLSEHGGRFLQFTGGKASMNLLKAVHPALRIELRTAIFRAVQSGTVVRANSVPLEEDGKRLMVDITVRPAQELAPDFLLVIFEQKEDAGAEVRHPAEPQGVVRHLEQENDHLKNELRDTVEQYEASTEELKASNEELQAMNEELRAATEELETSREELQSINEELTTVNQELKSKVEEVSHANGDLQNLMASTHIATIFLDRELRIKRYTPSAVALFNLIATDVGRPLSDLRHRLEYNSIAEDAERVLDHLAVSEREVRDLEGRCFLARMLPYRTTEDHIAGVVLTFVDITERKASHEALLASEAEFRSLVGQSAVGIAQSDIHGKFTYVNDRFCEITARSREQLLEGVTLADVTHPEDAGHSAPLLEKMFKTGEPLLVEKRYVLSSGELAWVINCVTPILGENGVVVGSTAVCIDITDRKEAEEALARSLIETEKARGEAEQAARTKDHFLAVLSHELRTPLTPVLLATQTLACEETLSEEGKEALEMIERNVKMETYLIDDLLDVTRISCGKLEITEKTMDLHEAVNKAVEICEGDVRDKQQQFQLDLAATQTMVSGDFIRLQQVLWNLLKNASKFSSQQGRISIRTYNEKEGIVVEVSDHGIGISPEILPLIFDAFKQADKTIARQFGGLGLGLAIAKAVVQAHKGSLSAQSEGRGKGACFSLHLKTLN